MSFDIPSQVISPDCLQTGMQVSGDSKTWVSVYKLGWKGVERAVILLSKTPNTHPAPHTLKRNKSIWRVADCRLTCHWSWGPHSSGSSYPWAVCSLLFRELLSATLGRGKSNDEGHAWLLSPTTTKKQDTLEVCLEAFQEHVFQTSIKIILKMIFVISYLTELQKLGLHCPFH